MENRNISSVIYFHKPMSRLDFLDMFVAKIAAQYDLRGWTFYYIERDGLHSVTKPNGQSDLSRNPDIEISGVLDADAFSYWSYQRPGLFREFLLSDKG